MEKKLQISLELQDKFTEQLKKAFRNAQDQVKNLSFEPKFLQAQQELAKKWQKQGISTPFMPSDKEIREAQAKSERHMKDMSERIAKVLGQRKQLEKEITEELKNQNLTLQERERLETVLTRVKQRQVDLTARGSAMEGLDPTKTAKGGLSGLFDKMGGIKAGLMGVLGTEIAKAILGAAQQVSNAPLNIAAMQGSAVAGLTGRQLQQQQSGQFIFETMFPGQRKEAMGMAQGQASRQRMLDMFNPTKWLGFATGEESARISQATTENFNKAFEGLVAKNPYVKDARDNLRENMMTYLSTQRTLGLNDQQLFTFIQHATGAGFMPQQQQQAMQQIIGAGGSSAMGRNAVDALKAERGLNLTNAGQVLGRLSGTMGGNKESKDALIEIISHGLDRSKFAEENRKFTENVSELVNKAGITSQEGVESLSGIMKDFITGTTTQRGIQGGMSGFQTISQMGAATSGYTGAQNIASLMKVPGIQQVRDPAVLEGLASLGLEDINKNNVYIQSAAATMGIDPSTLASSIRNQKFGAIRNAIQRPEAFRAGIKEMGAGMSSAAKGGGDISQFLSGFKFQTKEGKEALGSVAGMLRTLNPGIDPVAAQQAAMGMFKEQATEQALSDPQMKNVKSALEKEHQTSMDQANEAIDSKKSGRKMDELVYDSADQASVSVKSLAESIDELTRAANHFNETMKAADPASKAIAARQAQMGWMERLTGEYDAASRLMQNSAAGTPGYTPDYLQSMSPAGLLRELFKLHSASKLQTQVSTPSPSPGGKH